MFLSLAGVMMLIGTAQAAGPEASRLFPPESGLNRHRPAQALVEEYGPDFQRIDGCHGAVSHQWLMRGADGRPCRVTVEIDSRGRAGDTFYEGQGCPVQFPPPPQNCGATY